MPILFIVLFAILCVYLFDLLICLCYCKKKKRMDSAEDIFTADEDFTEANKKPGLTDKIKHLLYGWIYYRVKMLGKFPSQKYRTFLLKHVFQMDIADKVVIYGWNIIRAPWNISIGTGTVIGDAAYLDGRNHIAIGENVNFSSGVTIFTEQHDINDPLFRSLQSGGKVTIGNRAWISSYTTILPKVTVGEGAVLASGALTAKDLEPFGIYVGVPAKKISTRNTDLHYEFDGSFVPFI